MMKKMKSKSLGTALSRLAVLSFAFAAVLLFAVPGRSLYGSGGNENKAQVNAPGQPLKIRVGTDAHAFSMQFRVALKKEIFKKYNIDAEISTFSYGIDTVNAAILGETDSAEAMDFALASRFSDGYKLRVVASITESVPSGSHLYVRNDAIQSPADIRGHRIGVQKATANEYTWARYFEKWNIPSDQVEYVYLSSNAELLTAYQANQIDALWVSADTEAAIKEIPQSRSLGDNSLGGYLSQGYLLLDADFIKANPDGVARFLKALDEATTFINTNPEESAQIAYQELRIPLDAARKALASLRYEVRLTQADLDVISNVASWSYANGLFRNQYNLRDFVDPAPLRAALPGKVSLAQ
jgi:NitT/TauT family transport system substrate-binding protein